MPRFIGTTAFNLCALILGRAPFRISSKASTTPIVGQYLVKIANNGHNDGGGNDSRVGTPIAGARTIARVAAVPAIAHCSSPQMGTVPTHFPRSSHRSNDPLDDNGDSSPVNGDPKATPPTSGRHVIGGVATPPSEQTRPLCDTTGNTPEVGTTPTRTPMTLALAAPPSGSPLPLSSHAMSFPEVAVHVRYDDRG
jgi:hypothetical protein